MVSNCVLSLSLVLGAAAAPWSPCHFDEGCVFVFQSGLTSKVNTVSPWERKDECSPVPDAESKSAIHNGPPQQKRLNMKIKQLNLCGSKID